MKIKIDENSLSNINTQLSIHYLIYKITNQNNGMYYIGQHKTDNILDGYSGSGQYLQLAQQKYGLSIFIKEFLFDYDNFNDMNNKELELVQLSNCYPYNISSYNIREGGNNTLNPSSIEKMVETRKANGSYDSERNPMYGKHLSNFMELSSYNIMREKQRISIRAHAKDPQWRQKMSVVTSGKNNGMYGKKLKDCMSKEKYEQLKEKRRILSSGSNNPMYGKSSWEKCNDEQRARRIAKFKLHIKGKNKGRKLMKLPNATTYRLIKPDDIEKYIKLGYVFCSIKRKNKID